MKKTRNILLFKSENIGARACRERKKSEEEAENHQHQNWYVLPDDDEDGGGADGACALHWALPPPLPGSDVNAGARVTGISGARSLSNGGGGAAE